MTRWLVVILVLAAGVRMAGIEHGLPYRYVPDTHIVRGALGMAQERDLAPPAGTYTSYPYLMPYVLLPEFAALYAAGRVTGHWSSAQEFGARMIDDPSPLYRITRWVVLLFGLLGVYLAYRAGKRIGGERAAVIAALLVASSFLLVHLGKSARPWVPLATLVLLCADRSLAWVQRPSWKRALAMGATAGLSIACHQAGALAVLLPASAVVARLRRDPLPALGAGVAAAHVFGAVALLLGFPYLIRGGTANVGVQAAGAEETVNLGGQSLAFNQFGTGRFADTAFGFLSAEPGLIALLVLGLLLGRPRLRRPGFWPVVAIYPAVVVVLFLFYNGTHVRYLTTAVPLLALIAGAGGAALWKRRGGPVLVAACLVLPLVQALRLGYVMTATDTRTEFLAMVAGHVPAGSRIAVEAYGPPLRVSADAIELIEAQGRWTSRVEQREASGEAPVQPDRPPYSVVPIERFYEFASVWPHQFGLPGDERRPEKPIETFLDEMGCRYLVAVDRLPGGPRNSALDEVLARRGEKVAELHPFRGESGPGEAMLPMDPRRPLLAIWGVHRPGPSLTLWRLRDPPEQ